ncbi:hypothetical protein ICY20_18185 [Pseudomonas sp. P115]|uniref:hypothetical protein n=1 Tax=Pseudomonas pisciculturae TaxID=2730413 RepID=UPI0018921669|nr:hypothetical protein [Pseudomonas pisciculturae]MBF6029682.1 hypothetical protein [Pseudomonas pisciculturae]
MSDVEEDPGEEKPIVLSVYARVGENYMYVGGDCPDGCIEMGGARPEDENALDYTAQPDGTWAITQGTLNAKQSPVENAWRNEQMPLALENLTAVQLGADDVAGTEKQWKDYWLSLRKWTDTNPDFPDSTKRPVAPS